MQTSESYESFYSTAYSMLEGVAGLSPERRGEKLQQLITNYGMQLNGCLIRKFRISADDAADIVQQFLLMRLLIPSPEQNLAGQFLTAKRSESKLRFRNYLRRSLYNFYIDLRRRREVSVVQMDELDGVGFHIPDHADEDLREDATWANQLLNQARNAVQQECYLRDQANVWRIFYERILRPVESGEAALSYDDLCELGLASDPKQAANLLQTAVRKFNRILRSLVAGYLPCDEEALPESIEQELEELRRALATPHGIDLAEESDYSVVAVRTADTDRQQLLNVSEDVSSLWGDKDLNNFWNGLLQKRPAEIRMEMSGSNSTATNDVHQANSLTLSELLEAPHPTLEMLIALKDTAKQSAIQRNTVRENTTTCANVFPPNVTMLIYTLVIAIARLRCNQRITSDTDSRFIQRANRLLEFSWIDPLSRQILETWLRVLGQ